MELDFLEFFSACNPAQTLKFNNREDRQYYIDFASVRGANIIRTLERTIVLNKSLGNSTCQLFTGHIGCGKSTELRRLQANLEQQNFHVVYFESTEDLDMADVDVTDILLAITRQVSESLSKVGIRLKPNYFVKLFREIVDVLKTPIEVKEIEFSLPMELAKVTAQTKNSPDSRSRLRQYLEPRTKQIIDGINEEVLGKASTKLQELGKAGLVVIVDNLDRVDNRLKSGNTTQPEYLFIDRGEQLRKLNCHVIYTIPLVLKFSNNTQVLTNRFGGGLEPEALPMIPVCDRYGNKHEQGIALLQQMVLARAFPTIEPSQRLNFITKIFETENTLERLCFISGGHVRTLLGMLYRCLREEDPPISKACLERVISESRDNLALAITDDEWELIYKVWQAKTLSGEYSYQTLLKSSFVFEYPDPQEGKWFDINPILKETKQFRSFQG